jgi:hypothetical protein
MVDDLYYSKRVPKFEFVKYDNIKSAYVGTRSMTNHSLNAHVQTGLEVANLLTNFQVNLVNKIESTVEKVYKD